METLEPTELVQEEELTPLPQHVQAKPEFLVRYKALLGDQYDRFMQYSLSYGRKAVRVNTLKITVAQIKARLEKDWNMEPVPWCPEAFFLTYKHEERYDLGNLPEHQLGYLYVQDAASMIPPIVLDPQPGEMILDLCAAPGSKTTQMGAMMRNEGVIVANDFSADRAKPLGLNLQRCGVMNTIITLRANSRLPPLFDRILVDAPCSATGTIRRSLKTLQMWSPSAVTRMAAEQRGILRQAWRLLKPGGIMVYSTCTLEPEEDEGNVSWFLRENPDAELLLVELPIVRSPAVTAFEGKEYGLEVEKTLRIGPQDNDTEGFFVAKLRKKA